MTSDADLYGEVDDTLRFARLYIDTGNYERAQEVVRRSLSENPNDPALLACFAQTELLLNNYVSAAQSSYAALSIAPYDELAMRVYALALDGLGRGYDALWMAWRTVIAHPNESLDHRLYAGLLRKAGRRRSALQVVDVALRLNPTDVKALVLRGAILEELGRIRESTASYRAALVLDPGNAEALNNLAINRVRRGKFERALQGFLGAAGLDPALGDLARRNIGVVLRKLFRWVTIVAGILSFLVAVVAELNNEGHAAAVLRILTGLATIALIAVIGRLLRTIPRRVLISVLRDHLFVAARIFHALLAVVAGAWVSVFGGAVWMIPVGGFLVIGALFLIRVGLVIRS